MARRPRPDQESVTGRASTDRLPGLEAALIAAIILTIGVFVYLWAAHDRPGFAWLLPLVWVPLMIWDYRALGRGELTSLAVVIFSSVGVFLLTTMAILSQAGQTAGLIVGLVGFAIFVAMLGAGAYMLGRLADRQQ
ncbi:MAG: hypothetical protein ACLFRT_01100 [Actinomycetota bacterium]